jgi:hypothetical protein
MIMSAIGGTWRMPPAGVRDTRGVPRTVPGSGMERGCVGGSGTERGIVGGSRSPGGGGAGRAGILEIGIGATGVVVRDTAGIPCGGVTRPGGGVTAGMGSGGVGVMRGIRVGRRNIPIAMGTTQRSDEGATMRTVPRRSSIALRGAGSGGVPINVRLSSNASNMNGLPLPSMPPRTASFHLF